MLTRLFSYSKPIAFILLSILFVVAFGIENFFFTEIEVNTRVVFSKIGVLIIFLLIIFLLNFIVKRNKIHKQHTFAISSFVMLLICFPEILRSTQFVLGYFFLILSLRRLISLKSNISIKQKLFDSSFLLSISICFVPMHWLYLLVIYFGIIIYASQNYRHYLIPLVGLSVGFIIHFCSVLVLDNEFVHYSFYLLEFNGINYMFGDLKYNVLLGILLVLLIWVFFQLPSIYEKAKLHEKESLSMILLFTLTSILIFILNELPIAKDAIYIILPLSILIGSYFQLETTKKWIKEVHYFIIIIGILISAIY